MPRNPEDAKILEEKDAKIAKLNKRIEKLVIANYVHGMTFDIITPQYIHNLFII